MEPMAARKLPTAKVKEMTLLILMPISWAVSKSREAARMAMPILVFWIRVTSAATSTMTRNGVTTVTRLVWQPSTVTVSLIQGRAGYCLARPPVTYHIEFCKR